MSRHKDFEVKPKKKDQQKDMPPAYDSFPTSMRIRIDPTNNTSIPANEAVNEVKRWVDYNAK